MGVNGNPIICTIEFEWPFRNTFVICGKTTQKIYENKQPNASSWIPDCVANYKCLGSEGYDTNQHPDSSILNLI